MVFQQLYDLHVQEEEFIPYGGMGEDRFLGECMCTHALLLASNCQRLKYSIIQLSMISFIP
jgi:hypothetical protein